MRRFLDREFLRYFAASLVALAIDLGVLLSLAQVMHYIAAATIAFLIGSITHYLLAIHLVFSTRRLGEKTLTEAALFIGVGVLGLIVNITIIYLAVEWLVLPLLIAKLLAAGASFITGFIARKAMLFS